MQRRDRDRRPAALDQNPGKRRSREYRAPAHSGGCTPGRRGSVDEPRPGPPVIRWWLALRTINQKGPIAEAKWQDPGEGSVEYMGLGHSSAYVQVGGRERKRFTFPAAQPDSGQPGQRKIRHHPIDRRFQAPQAFQIPFRAEDRGPDIPRVTMPCGDQIEAGFRANDRRRDEPGAIESTPCRRLLRDVAEAGLGYDPNDGLFRPPHSTARNPRGFKDAGVQLGGAMSGGHV